MKPSVPAAAVPLLFLVTLGAVPKAESSKSSASEESRIVIPSGADGPKHPLTLPEIVQLREIDDVRISPDGKSVVFFVKHASVEKNDTRTALFRVSTGGGPPVKLLERKSLSSLRWTPDGRFVTFLSGDEKGTQVWRIAGGGGGPEPVTRHAESVGGYDLSPDGKRIAFTTSASPADEEKSKLDAAGIVYDDEVMNLRDVSLKNWIRKPSELWVADLAAKTESKLWESERPISDARWSPDGRRLAVVYTVPATREEPLIAFNSAIGVVSIDERVLRPLPGSGAARFSPAWSPDGRSLAFRSAEGTGGAILVQRVGEGASRNVTSGFPVSSAGPVWWSQDGSRLLFEKSDRSNVGLYSVPAAGGAPMKLSGGTDHLQDFSLSGDQRVAGCKRENPTTPAEVAVLTLPDGSPRTLTGLNPEYRNVELGEVRELTWKNKHGYETNGYLIHPLGYVPGRRYPFLLILYGFSDTFISQAQWISSFPAQVFSAKGFAVLLMNYPRYDKKWSYGDFKEATMQEAYSPLASIEKAVEVVTEMGIADPKRRGIMGWSYGSFLTDFTITHAPDLFQAASSGEGGLYDDGLYWVFGSKPYREYQIGIFGGPPYGETYERYREISPALNAARVRAPLLKEYESNNPVFGLQLYSALRTLGTPVELVLYPDEGHIFSQPKHRISSMQRNLDWMSYWLLGQEDPAPGKRDQYARWKRLRAGWTEKAAR